MSHWHIITTIHMSDEVPKKVQSTIKMKINFTFV